MASYEHVQGVDEVIKRLLEFPVKFEQNVVRGGLRAMAVVVQTSARPMVPVGRGVRELGSTSLYDTLRVSTYRVGKQMVASVKVGNRRKGVFYAGMVMRGTRPHEIRVRHAVDLAFARGIFRKSVQHPGARPNPFMERAFNASREHALQVGFDYVTERTKKLIAEQGARAT